jgi:hypothetical protein
MRGYSRELGTARELGSPTRVLDGEHLHMMADPPGVAAAIADLAQEALARPGLLLREMSRPNRTDLRPVGHQADHPRGVPCGADPEGGVEAVEVDERQQRRDLHQLVV